MMKRGKKLSVVQGVALSAIMLVGGLVQTPGIASAAEKSETETAVWSREDAQNYNLNKDNTAPDIDNVDQVAPDYWVWDTWPLRNRDGSIATVNGYKVVFALTASKEYTWSGRHDEAKIRYFYSKNGKDWEMGGLSYDPDKALGSRQWAGSAMMEEDGKVHLFYTASGRKGEETTTFEQRLAKTTFDIEVDKKDKSVELSNHGEHMILAEADGEYYETQDQKTGDIIYSFRDPWFFKDPKTKKEYIIFEGNSAGYEKTLDPENIGSEEFRKDHEVPAGAEDYNGNVGIASAENEDLTEFELLPPLLEADGVNQQLERPHVLVKGGQYYLFTISHQFTFAPGLNGPDGLYGFVNDSLRGDYQPLNDNGLVVANPEDDPFMTYSHAVMPNGTVISFVNEYIDENGNKQLGGTFAPTLKLSINGDETKVNGTLKPGQIIPSH